MWTCPEIWGADDRYLQSSQTHANLLDYTFTLNVDKLDAEEDGDKIHLTLKTVSLLISFFEAIPLTISIF